MRSGVMTCKRMLFWLLPLTAVFFWLSGVTEAKPTISGLLMNYNPGGGRLQIKRADGVIKTIVMRPNAIYALNGVEGSPHYFHNGMQVAVRICGSVTDDPLQGDLLIDAFSSGAVVQRRASSYGNTNVGTFAMVGGANGISSLSPIAPSPSVVGPIGLGGNFRGSLTNPGTAGPINNSAFPTMQGPAAGGLAVSTLNDGSSANSGTSLISDDVNKKANNPYAARDPYDSRGMMGGMTASSNGTNTGMAEMVGGDEPKPEQNNGIYTAPQASSGPLGMQIAQVQGGILGVDPRNRVLSIVPNGSTQPVHVKVPAGVCLSFLCGLHSRHGGAFDAGCSFRNGGETVHRCVPPPRSRKGKCPESWHSWNR